MTTRIVTKREAMGLEKGEEEETVGK